MCLLARARRRRREISRDAVEISRDAAVEVEMRRDASVEVERGGRGDLSPPLSPLPLPLLTVRVASRVNVALLTASLHSYTGTAVSRRTHWPTCCSAGRRRSRLWRRRSPAVCAELGGGAVNGASFTGRMSCEQESRIAELMALQAEMQPRSQPRLELRFGRGCARMSPLD